MLNPAISILHNLKNHTVREANRPITNSNKVWTTGLLGKEVVIKVHERSFKVYHEQGWKKVENPVEKSVGNGKGNISFKLTFNYKNVCLDESTDIEDENSKKKKKGQVHIHVFQCNQSNYNNFVSCNVYPIWYSLKPSRLYTGTLTNILIDVIM